MTAKKFEKLQSVTTVIVQNAEKTVQVTFFTENEEQKWQALGFADFAERKYKPFGIGNDHIYGEPIFEYLKATGLKLHDDVDADGNFMPAIVISNKCNKGCYHYNMGKPFNLYNIAQSYRISHDDSRVYEASYYMQSSYDDSKESIWKGSCRLRDPETSIFAQKYAFRHSLKDALQQPHVKQIKHRAATYRKALEYNS